MNQRIHSMESFVEDQSPISSHLSQSAAPLGLLHEIGRDLVSILDLDRLLGRTADQIRKLVDYQVFSLYLWDDRKETLNNRLTLLFDCAIEVRRELRLNEGITGAAARVRRPIRVADVNRDPRFVDCHVGIGIQSNLAVPLIFKERLIGVLNLESVQRSAFSADHETLLETLGSSIAVALENARLYEELSRKERDLQKDLRTARQVQHALLPNHSPLLDGLEIGRSYQPAFELGGDFYDFLSCGDGNLTVAVGDVSGKSTPAALHGSLAIGALRARIVQNPCSPKELLRRLNDQLVQPNLEGRFVAITVASYDQRLRSLKIVNAGLPRPLFYRGGAVTEVMAHGIPLGLFPDTRYDQHELWLRPDDVVVFCSDGLHESMDGKEAEFGSRGLSEKLVELSAGHAQDIADGLLEASLNHSADGSCKLRDDRTVVVLKATP